jgi:hypothetical protein
MAAAGSATLWTPAEIATELWLDAADASTITESSGTVSEWRDKSGSSLHLSQDTASLQPAYSTNALNGLPILTFDNDLLFRNTGLNGLTTVSIFAVMRYITASGQDVPMGVGATGAADAVRALYRANGGTTQGFAGWARDVTGSAYSTDTGGSHHIFAVWNTALSGSGYVFISRDGLSASYTPNPVGTTLAATHPGFSVGSLQGSLAGDYYSNISVAEVVVLSTAPSTTNQRLVEGYLAHKWGLAANLPADHPYKMEPPTP